MKNPRLDSSDFARLNEARNSASAVGGERGTVTASSGVTEPSATGPGFAKRRFLYRQLSKEFPQTPDDLDLNEESHL